MVEPAAVETLAVPVEMRDALRWMNSEMRLQPVKDASLQVESNPANFSGFQRQKCCVQKCPGGHACEKMAHPFPSYDSRGCDSRDGSTNATYFHVSSCAPQLVLAGRRRDAIKAGSDAG